MQPPPCRRRHSTVAHWRRDREAHSIATSTIVDILPGNRELWNRDNITTATHTLPVAPRTICCSIWLRTCPVARAHRHSSSTIIAVEHSNAQAAITAKPYQSLQCTTPRQTDCRQSPSLCNTVQPAHTVRDSAQDRRCRSAAQ